MDQPPEPAPPTDPARAFDHVADAYDRGRPGYPPEAVRWLLDGDPRRVLELGAGTGKLTEQLTRPATGPATGPATRPATGPATGPAPGPAVGRPAEKPARQVLASDPSGQMLHVLAGRAPGAQRLGAVAEALPVRDRSVDLVVAAQCWHWFDADAALREIARTLRSGGRFAAIWHRRDERVPWVRRLGRILGADQQEQRDDPTEALDESAMFETVERATYRFWQPLTNAELRDLALSRSGIAVLDQRRRQRVLTEVDTLYDEYGRGHDGMVLPYVTTACRATVLPWAVPRQTPAEETADSPATPPFGSGDPDDVDPDGLLIDFR